MNELAEYVVENPDAAQLPICAVLGGAAGYMEQRIKYSGGDYEGYGMAAIISGALYSTLSEIAEEHLAQGKEQGFSSLEQALSDPEGTSFAFLSFLGGREAGKRYIQEKQTDYRN